MTVVADARWRPSRAGILNVYQYEDETLHFAVAGCCCAG